MLMLRLLSETPMSVTQVKSIQIKPSRIACFCSCLNVVLSQSSVINTIGKGLLNS